MGTTEHLADGVTVRGPKVPRQEEVLTPEALAFVAELERRFGARRRQLLESRRGRQQAIDAGELPEFLPETRAIRTAAWQIAPTPAPLQERKVEITGPVDRKMMINALNSGASVFMADFEDANSPTWTNVVAGQANLFDAVRRTISFEGPDGRSYQLNDQIATLMVRPRGWHLPEAHVLVDGQPISASLFDAGLYLFHNAAELVRRGLGPYLYLPKLQSFLEARLWNDVFSFAEDRLGLPRGTIRATVLIEHILAAFEMEEILYELREHAAGLNAGRWDYIFSIIKTFHSRKEFVLPDRAQVTMTVPFMRAYTTLLVHTCHRRGAHAIGGMAAFIPNRRDPRVNEVALQKVREDKQREVEDGFDGTWVAHPDLVPVAMEVFQAKTASRPRPQPGDALPVEAEDLLRFTVPGGRITLAGLQNNISVALQYMESWLRGVGAVAIYNLMEDAATAEISRTQVWQWLHHGAVLDTGERVNESLVRRLAADEAERLRAGREGSDQLDAALQLFLATALSPECTEFFTLPAYDILNQIHDGSRPG